MATSSGNLIYFAYGSNMLLRRLKDRCPSANPIGTGFVAQRRLTFHKVSRDKSGKCDIERTSNLTDRVYGVLFQIAASEKQQLDDAEGLHHGYEEETVTVVTSAGEVQAKTYFATAKDSARRPYQWYKDLVIAGAVENNLPQPHIDWLRAIESIADPDPDSCAANERFLSDPPAHP
jgi:hypothetical protein